MKPDRHTLILALAAVAAVALLMAAGVLYAGRLSHRYAAEITSRLTAVADLKARQVTSWRAERLADGKFVQQNKRLSRLFLALADQPSNARLREEYLEWIEAFTGSYGYAGGILCDRNASPIFAHPPRNGVAPSVRRELPRIVRDGRVVMSGLRSSDSLNVPTIDLIVPIVGNTRDLALVLQIDINAAFSPMLLEWPTMIGRSAEVIVVQDDQDGVLIVEPESLGEAPRMEFHWLSRDLLLAQRLRERALPASIEALDQHGRDVIAAANPVSGSSWHVIAKVEQAEVSEALGFERTLVISLAVLLSVVVTLVAFVVYRYRAEGEVRLALEAERSRTVAEQRLAEREAHFTSIVNAGDALMWTSGPDDRCTWVNEPWLVFTGGPLDVELGDGWLRRVHPDDLAGRERVTSAAFAARQPFRVEYRLRRHDGAYRWMNDRGTPRFDQHGTFIGYAGICFDITERRIAEDEARVSRMRMELALIGANAGSWDWFIPTGEITINQRWASMLGYTVEDLKPIGIQTWERLVHPDDLKVAQEQLQEHFAGRREWYAVEVRMQHRSGDWVWVLTSGKVTERDAHGGPLRMNGTHIDISPFKKSEQALRKSEEKFRLFAERIDEVFWMADPSINTMNYISPGYEQVWGRTCESLYSDPKSFAEAILPEDRERVFAVLAKQQEGLEFDHEYRIRRPDGSIRVIWDRGYPVRDEHGALTLYVGVAQDVTERKAMEESMQTAADRWQALFREAPLHATLFRLIKDDRNEIVDWEVVEVSPLAAAALGGSRDSVVGKRVSTIYGAEAMRDYIALSREVAASGQARTFESPFEPSGRVYQSTVFVIGREYYIILALDVTDLRTSELKVRQLSLAVQQAPTSVTILDANGTIEYVNDAFTRMTGYGPGEVLGTSTPILQPGLLDAEAHAALVRAITTGKPWRGELRIRRKDGAEYWDAVMIAPVIDRSGSLANLICIEENITEKKLAHEQLMKAQRVESIGTIAGGMAHDLNNVLGPILLAMEYLRTVTADDQAQRMLEVMERSATRGADLIKQVLAFARGQEGVREAIEVGPVVEDVRRMVLQTFPKDISLRVDIVPDLPPLAGDRTQLHQVVMNLLLNARDALPQGGTISVSVDTETIDEAYAQMQLGAAAGTYVRLRVKDDGIGIPPKDLERIFDPFFTTKELGQGTGLGLSTVQSIVRDHGGFITVVSEVQRGSTFCVHLPAASGAATPEEPRPAAAVGGQGELILVVDDEEAMREITMQTLRTNGYTVVEAADGAQAVVLVAEHKGRIEAVVVDMMMPLMDGPSTIQVISKMQPRMRFVAVSGLRREEFKQPLPSHVAFLQKPYTASMLLSALHRVLAAEAMTDA